MLRLMPSEQNVIIFCPGGPQDCWQQGWQKVAQCPDPVESAGPKSHLSRAASPGGVAQAEPGYCMGPEQEFCGKNEATRQITNDAKGRILQRKLTFMCH